MNLVHNHLPHQQKECCHIAAALILQKQHVVAQSGFSRAGMEDFILYNQGLQH